jgi:WYL domain
VRNWARKVASDEPKYQGANSFFGVMAVFGGGEEPGKPIARFGRFAAFARTGGQELRRAVLPQQNGRAEQTGRPGERVISPHSLVKASGRWHLRAFDYQRMAFVDFSLSRIAASSPTDEKSAVPCDLDSDWHSLVDVEFIPHPELSSDQKKMVASEFGMVKGQVTVSIRRALLFYLLDEMRLLTAVMRSDPELAKGTTLWIRNTEAVARELAGAKMKQAWQKT